jgi:signal transduction histidine kinase
MTHSWLAIILISLALVMALLWITYQRLHRHKKLIRLQSDEIERQLRELMKQNEIQQRLNYEKQQIISVVSHDLKGPFNRIFALAQLMDMSGNLTEEQQEYLDKIHQITVDGLSMMRNLLDKRKLEESGMDMAPEELNLFSQLHSLIKNYRTLAEKKDITIEFTGPDPARIFSDRNFINRIFENLLSNAVKFSPSGKTIYVSMKEEAEESYRINIKDEGPGMTLEDTGKIFQKFQRLSAQPTAGESSTGLGLWIVKSLVEKAGGEVSCDSVAGKGATFSVLLKKSVN